MKRIGKGMCAMLCIALAGTLLGGCSDPSAAIQGKEGQAYLLQSGDQQGAAVLSVYDSAGNKFKELEYALCRPLLPADASDQPYAQTQFYRIEQGEPHYWLVSNPYETDAGTRVMDWTLVSPMGEVLGDSVYRSVQWMQESGLIAMVSAGNYELLDLQGNPIGSIQGGADVNATVTERWIRIAGEGGATLNVSGTTVHTPSGTSYYTWDAQPLSEGWDNGNLFSGELCAVCKDGLWGFIDGSGNVAISPQFAAANDFNDAGYCVVSDEKGLDFIIDGTGRRVSDRAQRIVLGETDIFQVVLQGSESWCYARANLQPLGDAQFDRVDPFRDGLGIGYTQQEEALDAHLMDAQGNAIDLGALRPINILGEGAIVARAADGRVGLCDAAGQWLLQPDYAEIQRSISGEGLLYGALGDNQRVGYIMNNGQIALPVEYESVSYTDGYVFIARINGQQCLVGAQN